MISARSRLISTEIRSCLIELVTELSVHAPASLFLQPEVKYKDQDNESIEADHLCSSTGLLYSDEG